jgi:hypothetical protein
VQQPQFVPEKLIVAFVQLFTVSMPISNHVIMSKASSKFVQSKEGYSQRLVPFTTPTGCQYVEIVIIVAAPRASRCCGLGALVTRGLNVVATAAACGVRVAFAFVNDINIKRYKRPEGSRRELGKTSQNAIALGRYTSTHSALDG